jgi:hypothetical protein
MERLFLRFFDLDSLGHIAETPVGPVRGMNYADWASQLDALRIEDWLLVV